MKILFLIALCLFEVTFSEKTQLLLGQFECALCKLIHLCNYCIYQISLSDGSVLYNTTVNFKSLTLNPKQEALFKVQERDSETIVGFINDFREMENNNVTIVEGFPDLINIFVDRENIKIRQHTFPNQGPLYEVAFTNQENDFNISVLIYSCNVDVDEAK